MNDEPSVSETANEPALERLVQVNVRLPESLKKAAIDIANLDAVTLQEFITQAVSEKVDANAGRRIEILRARREALSKELGESAAILDLLDTLQL